MYQTNERIDFAVSRSAEQPRTASDLKLQLDGADGSQLVFTFAVKPAPVQGKSARDVEHVHVNGWLLRPGKYKVTATCNGATDKTDIDVFSHVRRSSFRLINWGRAQGSAQLAQGEDGLGYNLFFGQYGQDTDAHFIRAGVEFMANCTMSGGHQMDLRSECDWSDPWVIRGGTRRVVRRAFIRCSRCWPASIR